MARLHSNNYNTTTTAGISAVAVTLPVASVTGLPAIGGVDFCHLTIQQGSNIEIVKGTAVSSLNITIQRALEGTTALAFTSGAIVSIRPTKDSVDRKADGAASSTDNAIARFDSTTGKILQNSVVTVSDTGTLAGVESITVNTTTVANDDKVLINDTSDSNNIKTVIAQEIANLSGLIDNELPLIEDQSLNGMDGTSTLLMENSTGITYPSSANFNVTLGNYTNALLNTSQTINSATPGGTNGVYGDRILLTYSDSGTNDLSRLNVVGRNTIVNWTSANTAQTLIANQNLVTYNGSNQGGRTTSQILSSISTVSINPPASSTATISTVRGSLSSVTIGYPTNTAITTNITTIDVYGCTSSISSTAASNTTTITNFHFFNTLGAGFSAAGAGSTLTITNLYGLRLQSPTVGANTTITNRYGVSSEDASARNVFAGIIEPSQTLGVLGTTTNNNANAGSIGEVISSVIASGSAVALTTVTAADMTSISLTAGDWDVWGNVTFIPDATTVVVQARGWLSSTSATLPDASLYNGVQNAAAGIVAADNFGFTVPPQRLSLSATTTVYISAIANFNTSTMAVCGGIYARRRR